MFKDWTLIELNVFYADVFNLVHIDDQNRLLS